MQTIAEQLTGIVGADNVLQGNDVSGRYQHDWSAETPGMPLAVVRPGTTDELARVLACCHEQDQCVVVQGGMTGLCGGANPREAELAISLERLRGIEEIDAASMTMTVKAGTALEQIQQAAEAEGFVFPLDLGARGSCNIGGNISTNAGGNQVLRYGMTRNLVLGLEAVLADGTVLSSMNRMLKNNAGYDLKQLFIGTEGTLGVVSRAVLRLFPRSRSRCTALLALNSLDEVISLLRTLSTDFGASLSAFEVMWASYFDFIVEHVAQARSPFDSRFPVYVLTEMEGPDQERDQAVFENSLARAMEGGLVADAVLATSERERESFWQIRDGVGDIGPFIRDSANFDISIPISSMNDFLDELDHAFRKEFPDAVKLVFGHIADSNLHIICSNSGEAERKAIYALMYRLVGEFVGSISAEHGIGVQKLDYLHYSRTPEEVALMKVLKQALDPKGILNRGRVVPW